MNEREKRGRVGSLYWPRCITLKGVFSCLHILRHAQVWWRAVQDSHDCPFSVVFDWATKPVQYHQQCEWDHVSFMPNWIWGGWSLDCRWNCVLDWDNLKQLILSGDDRQEAVCGNDLLREKELSKRETGINVILLYDWNVCMVAPIYIHRLISHCQVHRLSGSSVLTIHTRS